MEAMWTRFNPAVRKLVELVTDGVIGEVRTVTADFAVEFPYDPEHRLFAPDLGGGALLDLGVYPVSFAWMLLGAPRQVHAVAGLAPNGVDANTAVLFGYDSGAVALLHCSVESAGPATATILGTKGRIDVDSYFFRPTSFTVRPHDAEPWTYTIELDGHGYTYQAAEVAKRLRAGELESPLMPLDESVAIMHTLDTIRDALRFKSDP
jgi:predicted dehydrogenase